MKLYGLTAIISSFSSGERNPPKHPPALDVLPIDTAIRRIGNTASADPQLRIHLRAYVRSFMRRGIM